MIVTFLNDYILNGLASTYIRASLCFWPAKPNIPTVCPLENSADSCSRVTTKNENADHANFRVDMSIKVPKVKIHIVTKLHVSTQ